MGKKKKIMRQILINQTVIMDLLQMVACYRPEYALTKEVVVQTIRNTDLLLYEPYSVKCVGISERTFVEMCKRHKVRHKFKYIDHRSKLALGKEPVFIVTFHEFLCDGMTADIIVNNSGKVSQFPNALSDSKYCGGKKCNTLEGFFDEIVQNYPQLKVAKERGSN